MQSLHTPLQIGLTVAMAVCLLVALWKGDGSARLAALGMVAGSVLSALVQDRANPDAAQWLIMGVDAAYLGLLAAIAWRWPARWLVWAAAFQLAQAVTHLSFALNPEILGRAYISTSYVLFAGLLAALFAGLLRSEAAHEHDGRTDRCD